MFGRCFSQTGAGAAVSCGRLTELLVSAVAAKLRLFIETNNFNTEITKNKNLLLFFSLVSCI